MTALTLPAVPASLPAPTTGVGFAAPAFPNRAANPAFASHLQPQAHSSNLPKSQNDQEDASVLPSPFDASHVAPEIRIATGAHTSSQHAVGHDFTPEAHRRAMLQRADSAEKPITDDGNLLPDNGRRLPLALTLPDLADPTAVMPPPNGSPHAQSAPALTSAPANPAAEAGSFAQQANAHDTSITNVPNSHDTGDLERLIARSRQHANGEPRPPLSEHTELPALRDMLDEPRPLYSRIPSETDRTILRNTAQPEPADWHAPRDTINEPRMLSNNAGNNAESGFQQRPEGIRPTVSGATSSAPQANENSLSPQMDTVIETILLSRETGKVARGEMVLRHAEFGAVVMGLEQGDGDLRAILTSRDPGFASAAQLALAERVAASATESGSTQPRQNDHAAPHQNGSGQDGGAGNTHSNGNSHHHQHATLTAYPEELTAQPDLDAQDGKHSSRAASLTGGSSREILA